VTKIKIIPQLISIKDFKKNKGFNLFPACRQAGNTDYQDLTAITDISTLTSKGNLLTSTVSLAG